MIMQLSLVNHTVSTEDDSFLFTAVAQLNLAGPKAVQDKQQYTVIAKHNLDAGKKAMEMSEFSSAFNYFDNGISFLRKRHWQEEYALSLELYNLAAKCALALQDTSNMTMLCSSISKNSRDPNDSLDASFLTMTALSHTNLLQSVDYGFSLLAQLGAGLNMRKLPSREDTVKQIRQTQTMLNNITDETILNYHISTDYKKIMAMKLLAKMTNCLVQCKPLLAPLVIVKLVRLTIEHGLVSELIFTSTSSSPVHYSFLHLSVICIRSWPRFLWRHDCCAR
jgi:predicted ATPase